MSEDLKESKDSCVNYAMGQDDETKRRIFTGLFEYVDRLVNEDILVKALNDEAKHEWFNNRYYQDRIDKALEYIKEYLYINEETGEYCLTHTFDSSNLYELMKILKENKV